LDLLYRWNSCDLSCYGPFRFTEMIRCKIQKPDQGTFYTYIPYVPAKGSIVDFYNPDKGYEYGHVFETRTCLNSGGEFDYLFIILVK